jgi:peptidase E
MGISANMNVLTESINMEFVRCRPIVTAASSDYQKGLNLPDLSIVGVNGSI